MRYEGSCHCGKIAFEVEGEFAEAVDCNCSLCRRRGGLLAFVARDKLTLKTPEADLSTYLFNKHVIQHHFCDACGIAPFGEGEGPHGQMAAVNLRCLPEFDIEAVKIVKYDGRSVQEQGEMQFWLRVRMWRNEALPIKLSAPCLLTGSAYMFSGS